MRKIWVTLILLLIFTLVGFAALPGAGGAALRSELAKRYSEGGVAALAGAFFDGAVGKLSEQRMAELTAYMERQIAAELATAGKLKTGKIKLGPQAGAAPQKSRQTLDNMYVVNPKPEPIQDAPVPSPVITEAVAPPPAPPQTEAAFGGLIKHQERGPAPGPDPFWTEERKREAIANGEPRSKNRMCLFMCK